MTNIDDLRNNLHRTVKLALDSGEARNVEEAERIFSNYRMQVVIGPDANHDPTLQVAALTAVNCAARTFLGGVSVVGATGPLTVRIPRQSDFPTCLVSLGGRSKQEIDLEVPTFLIGEPPSSGLEPDAIRAVVNGWAGGVQPAKWNSAHADFRSAFTPAGVLAGALGISEIFQRVRGSNPMACKRATGLNLWQIERDWRSKDDAPPLRRIPRSLWLVGLGNLGQAYLWTLGLLPYGNESAEVVLQDVDSIGGSNISTSVLTTTDLIGKLKTRAMADWAESRGFKTRIVERLFGRNFEVDSQDPPVILMGVDNILARRNVEYAGFKRVIEAGLGGGKQEFLGINLHTFPARKSAQDVWNRSIDPVVNLDKPAYKGLIESTGDRCGIVQIAERSVGAPFVGVVAASMVIAELLRLVECERHYEIVSCHLRDLSLRIVENGDTWGPFNIGALDVSP